MATRGRVPGALADLEQAQAVQARWEASAATKQAELDDLERRMGEEVLAAEDGDATSARIVADVTRLRIGTEADARTATAAAGRVVEAKRAVLRAEAEDLREQLAEARQRKVEHDRKLESLLKQLTEHDGARYVVWEPTRDDIDQGGPGFSWATSRSDVLARPIAKLETRIKLLDLAAVGHNVPTFDARQYLLPAEAFSPHLRALFPELVSHDPLYSG